MRYLLTAAESRALPVTGLFDLIDRIGQSLINFFGVVLDFINFIIGSIVQIAQLFYWVFGTVSSFGAFFPSFLSAFLFLYLFTLVGQLIIRTV